MKCRFRLVVCLGCLLFALPARAIEAVVSFAVFQKPAPTPAATDSAFLEVYWQINPASLHYRRGDSSLLSARIQTRLRVYEDTTPIREDRYVLQTRPLPPGAAAAQPIVELQRFYLPKGDFRISLQLAEPDFPAGAFLYQDSVRIGGLEGPAYSSLQLIDTSYPGLQPGPFLKNGQQQIPKMVNFLDEGQRHLGYYLELYRTDKLAADRFPLVQRIYISRRKEEEAMVRFQQYDTLRTGAPVTSFLHSVQTATLPSGNYYLQAELKDKYGQVLTTQSVFFQAVNQHPEEFNTVVSGEAAGKLSPDNIRMFDLSKTFVAKYDPAQLRAILKMILPVANPVEVATIDGFLRKPDELYTRYFIYNFFSQRDPKRPEQAWKEYSDLVREVNRQFRSGGTMGYETDRGIVYLKYGKPDERVIVPNESGAQPYEIWRYNIIGHAGQNGTFLFYQPGMVGGDYKLLHSTVIGELRNEAWRSVLYTTGHSSGNGNSRAEQYIGNK